MKRLHLDALRDIAIEYIPKAKLIQANAGRSRDNYNWALLSTAFLVELAATAPATEQAAAILLNHVMALSVIWDEDQRLTNSERQYTEQAAINAAYELFQLTKTAPPAWLPSANIRLEEVEPEPEIPAKTPAPPTSIVSPVPQPGTMLTSEQAAAYLNIKPQTLRSWKSQGKGPKNLRVVSSGGRNRYYAEDVLQAMQDGWR